MPILTWSREFSINVEELDNHHRDMVHMINYLHDAMKRGEGREAIYHLFRALNAYAAVHFATEEKYMTEHGYPDYHLHRAEHRGFENTVKEFQEGYNGGKPPSSLAVYRFLKDWFHEHTRGTDREAGRFFNKVGLR